jgi:hypothetical protein
VVSALCAIIAKPFCEDGRVLLVLSISTYEKSWQHGAEQISNLVGFEALSNRMYDCFVDHKELVGNQVELQQGVRILRSIAGTARVESLCSNHKALVRDCLFWCSGEKEDAEREGGPTVSVCGLASR